MQHLSNTLIERETAVSVVRGRVDFGEGAGHAMGLSKQATYGEHGDWTDLVSCQRENLVPLRARECANGCKFCFVARGYKRQR